MKNNTILFTFLFAVFVVSVTIIFVPNTKIFADNIDYKIQIDNVKISNDKTKLLVDITAKIFEDDFVTVKLINSEDEIMHMLWYKVKANKLTSFSHTFTDIDQLRERGIYNILVEYDNLRANYIIKLN